MPLSRSLTQLFRPNELFVGAGFRALFAPFDIYAASQTSQTTVGPTIFDLQTALPVNTNAPPAGWTDLGWIKNFKITPQSKVGQVRSGYRGAVRAQYRGEAGEMVDFEFYECARMQFKIAAGNIPFNLLANPTPSTIGPMSGTGAQAVAVGASGYQAAGAGTTAGSPTVFVAAGSGSLFPAGSYIVCDDDYVPNTPGIIGDVGAPAFPNQIVDVNYIRRTSDYVARVLQVKANAVAGQDGLVLDQPFIGGGSSGQLSTTPDTAPDASAKVQKIIGWAVREGATYITQWSSLFVLDSVDAAQIALYYPHISINQFKDIMQWKIENIGQTDEGGYGLQCSMTAMAYDDPLDGETIVRYLAFAPRPGQNIAI